MAIKSLVALLLSIILFACSSPSPRYMGTPPISLTISGVKFDVYRDQNNVQAIRLAGRLPQGESAIKLAAIEAIQKATGCTVNPSTLDGDMEVINAIISC